MIQKSAYMLANSTSALTDVTNVVCKLNNQIEQLTNDSMIFRQVSQSADVSVMAIKEDLTEAKACNLCLRAFSRLPPFTLPAHLYWRGTHILIWIRRFMCSVNGAFQGLSMLRL